jgi:hypothetical protein
MDKVYAEIELIDGDGLALVRRNVICESEVRRINADSRGLMLCSNDEI